MGTITKRGELQWQAKVRRKGYPAQSRTFSYKEDAEKWVRELERAADTGGVVDRREAEKNTLGAILRRYQTEVTPSKKSADIESVKMVQVEPLAEFGGWGWRWTPEGGLGVVARAGEGILVVLRDGRRFTVTVDDAETGAALLAAYASATEIGERAP